MGVGTRGGAARWMPAPLEDVDFDAVLAQIRADWIAVGLIRPPRPVATPRHLRVVRVPAVRESEAA